MKRLSQTKSNTAKHTEDSNKSAQDVVKHSHQDTNYTTTWEVTNVLGLIVHGLSKLTLQETCTVYTVKSTGEERVQVQKL